MVSFPFRAYQPWEPYHRDLLRDSVGGSEACCRLDTHLLYHEGFGILGYWVSKTGRNRTGGKSKAGRLVQTSPKTKTDGDFVAREQARMDDSMECQTPDVTRVIVTPIVSKHNGIIG
jgi:hypothetical protein